MSRIVVTEYVTLDGVMHEPGEWSFPFFDDQVAKWKFDELMASDAQLLGRVTYEGFAAAWPTMTDEMGFGDKMNGMPKYVVSSTLQDPSWTNSRVISLDEVGEIPEANILVAGSGMLVDALLGRGLVDELRLLTHPIVLGSGKRLFADGLPTASFELVDLQQFGTGVVALTYRPAAT
jgi:dihydrofolate reductase